MMPTESKPNTSKAKLLVLELTSPVNRTAFRELKNLESKSQTFPLLSSFTRTDCSLMLALNGVGGQLLDAAHEDTAALVQLIMDRQ